MSFADTTAYGDIRDYLAAREDATSACDVLHIDTQFNRRWSAKFEIPQTECRGNLSFATNNPEVAQLVKDWSFDFGKHYAPRSLEDVGSEDLIDVLQSAHHISDLDFHVRTAFVVEHHEELREESSVTLDDPDPESDQIPRATKVVEEANAAEREMLEELPLPGSPIGEQERRKKWLKLPRNSRIAIRKLHNEWGHKPKGVLKAILKASKKRLKNT